MSYILDAIKKAENQRQREQVPTLESVIREGSRPRYRFSWKWLAIVIAVVVLVVAAIWFQQPVRDRVNAYLPRISGWVGAQYERVSSRLGGSKEAPAPATDQGQGASTLSQEPGKILDRLDVSAVSWSNDPNRRFIMDGERIFREGDRIRGYEIINIERDSIVVAADGQRYRINY